MFGDLRDSPFQKTNDETVRKRPPSIKRQRRPSLLGNPEVAAVPYNHRLLEKLREGSLEKEEDILEVARLLLPGKKFGPYAIARAGLAGELIEHLKQQRALIKSGEDEFLSTVRVRTRFIRELLQLAMEGYIQELNERDRTGLSIYRLETHFTETAENGWGYFTFSIKKMRKVLIGPRGFLIKDKGEYDSGEIRFTGSNPAGRSLKSDIDLTITSQRESTSTGIMLKFYLNSEHTAAAARGTIPFIFDEDVMDVGAFIHGKKPDKSDGYAHVGEMRNSVGKVTQRKIQVRESALAMLPYVQASKRRAGKSRWRNFFFNRFKGRYKNKYQSSGDNKVPFSDVEEQLNSLMNLQDEINDGNRVDELKNALERIKAIQLQIEEGEVEDMDALIKDYYLNMAKYLLAQPDSAYTRGLAGIGVTKLQQKDDEYEPEEQDYLEAALEALGHFKEGFEERVEDGVDMLSILRKLAKYGRRALYGLTNGTDDLSTVPGIKSSHRLFLNTMKELYEAKLDERLDGTQKGALERALVNRLFQYKFFQKRFVRKCLDEIFILAARQHALVLDAEYGEEPDDPMYDLL